MKQELLKSQTINFRLPRKLKKAGRREVMVWYDGYLPLFYGKRKSKWANKLEMMFCRLDDAWIDKECFETWLPLRIFKLYIAFGKRKYTVKENHDINFISDILGTTDTRAKNIIHSDNPYYDVPLDEAVKLIENS